MLPLSLHCLRALWGEAEPEVTLFGWSKNKQQKREKEQGATWLQTVKSSAMPSPAMPASQRLPPNLLQPTAFAKEVLLENALLQLKASFLTALASK